MYEDCLKLSMQSIDLPVLDISPDAQVLDFSLRYTLGMGALELAKPKVLRMYVTPPYALKCDFPAGALPLIMDIGRSYPIHCSRMPNFTACAHVSVATDRGSLQITLPSQVETHAQIEQRIGYDTLEHRLGQDEQRLSSLASSINEVSSDVGQFMELIAALGLHVNQSDDSIKDALRDGPCTACFACGGKFPRPLVFMKRPKEVHQTLGRPDPCGQGKNEDKFKFFVCCIDSSVLA